MIKILRTYFALFRKHFALFIVSISSIVLPAALIAAETTTSKGYAFITSSVDKNIFRARAIENALQKIVLEADQNLTSFSFVENGQVILDHIQKNSAVKVLQYEVINESIKNKKYTVTVQATLAKADESHTLSVCKKADVKSINFSLKLFSDFNQFPAWAIISEEWLLEKIEKYPFEKNLSYSSIKQDQKNKIDLYTLYDRSEQNIQKASLYTLQTEVFFDKKLTNHFVEKSVALSLNIKSTLMRDGKALNQLNKTKNFIIKENTFNNLLRMKARADWDNTKQKIVRFLTQQLNSQIAQLNCMNITPRVFARAGTPFIDYGRLDGIAKSDMFVVKTDNTKKTYLKILEIKDHETQVEIVSQKDNIANIEGKTVELVAGS